MKFHAIYAVAAFMVVIGLVLANYSVSAAERFYAKFLILAGVVFVVLGLSWGCSSPTAPTATLRFVFLAAPGCSPGTIASPKKLADGSYPDPLLVVNAGTVQAWWVIEGQAQGYEFAEVGAALMVCKKLAGGVQ